MIFRQAILVLILVGVFVLYAVDTRVHAFPSEAELPPATQTVIIALRHTIPPERDVMARGAVLARRIQIRQLQEQFVTMRLNDVDVWQMQTMPVIIATVNADTLAQLQQDPAVASVHVSRLFRHATSESTSQIGARALHASGITGAGSSVAVLDTGVDGQHSALRGQVIREACFSTTNEAYGSTSVCAGGASMKSGSGSGVPCDVTLDACHHGTHVAGIVAGREVTQAGVTTRGIAPDARIIAVQVFSRFAANHEAAMCGVDATTDCVLAYEHDLLRALDWLATEYDPSTWGTLAAVNMSLGDGHYDVACDTLGGTDAYPFKWYIDQLRELGVATVVAAGNAGSATGIAFPACVSSAISVGSVTSTKPSYGLHDRPSVFSNAVSSVANRANGSGDLLLDLYAPGELIRSSIATPGGNTFAEYSGTSMAAPHVAGAWALMKSLRPRASVTQVYRWLYETGEPIAETRPGFDGALRVPRIDVARAAGLVRATTAPVALSTWALDMGDVRIGQSLRQRISIRYTTTPATVRWTLSGRYFRIDAVSCEGFVDDLTPVCSFDVVYTPTTATPGQVTNASIRLEVNRLVLTIGLTGRAVSTLPNVALTQTAQLQATTQALQTQTATPTLWATPTAIRSAKTLIAVATRTQRQRNDNAATMTQAVLWSDQTATQGALIGESTFTPSRTPVATRTRTTLAITNTIMHAKTATQRMKVRATTTALSAATRTQSARTRATAQAIAVAQTTTRLVMMGLPTYTATPRGRMTHTATATQPIVATRTPSIAYITTHNYALPKGYRALVRSPLGDKSLLLYAGDSTKALMPELIIVNPAMQQVQSTLRLPGVDATALAAIANVPNQFVVAGRLNWDSLYLQIYDVRDATFVLKGTHIAPLPGGSTITALYATDQRIMIALAHKTTPAAYPSGQLVVFERLTEQRYMQLTVATDPIAGVATSIRAIDNSDDQLVLAGFVPGKKYTGFVQSLRWTGTAYTSQFVLPRAQPVTDLATYALVRGLTRVHLVFGAQTQGLAVLQLDEKTGGMSQVVSTLPIVASKLDQNADQLAVMGFDTVSRKNVTSVYQWSVDRLQLRRTITHSNRDGGIVGIVLYGTSIAFADTAWLRFSR